MGDDRVVLPQEVEPLHYDLKIDTNVDQPNENGDLEFSGEVSVELQLHKPGMQTLTLHSKELDIFECTYNDTFKPSDVKYDENLTTVTFSFDDALPEGVGKLYMKFSGVHNNQMAGFYRSNYVNAANETKTMVSTQFEPLDARRCFPCIDEPARKATFKCTLIVDTGLTALSNMPEASSTVREDGKSVILFETTPKMSTYLLAFCVGEFDYVEGKTKSGVLMRVYTPPEKQKIGDFALEIGLKALDLLDEAFGEKFPLPKMDMIAIPEFAAGAMENWGLITYRETDLLLNPANTSAMQKVRVASVVVHELAHQWFGNLVTMEWWNDLWLNEGFASYMESYILNKMYPEWAMHEAFVVDTQSRALALDSLVSSHPIEVPIKHAEEVEEVFDMISYSKGSCIVRFLYALLGENLFLKGLQEYIKKHKYENTKTRDLWKAWEDVSNHAISEIMSSWTGKMGFPLVTVEDFKLNEEKTAYNVVLSQEWFLSNGSKAPEERTWQIPIFLSTSSGLRVHPEMFKEKKQTFVVDYLDESAWIKLNGGQNIPLRVNYTLELWERLITACQKQELKDKSDHAGLILDALALVKAKTLDPTILLKLLNASKHEDSYPVWQAIDESLLTLSEALEELPDLAFAFEIFASGLVHEKANNLGWQNEDDDEILIRLLRTLLIRLQCTYESWDKRIQDEALKRFNYFVENPKSLHISEKLPPDVKLPILRVVLANPANKKAYEELRKLVILLESSYEKRDIFLTIGYVHSLDSKIDVLDWATSGEIKIQDFFYPFHSVSRSGIEGLKLTWEYFQQNFDRIHSMVKTASASIFNSVISASCARFKSQEKADEVEDFFEGKLLTNSKRTIEQIVENIRANSDFVEYLKDSDGFTEFLVGFGEGEIKRKGASYYSSYLEYAESKSSASDLKKSPLFTLLKVGNERETAKGKQKSKSKGENESKKGKQKLSEAIENKPKRTKSRWTLTAFGQYKRMQ